MLPCGIFFVSVLVNLQWRICICSNWRRRRIHAKTEQRMRLENMYTALIYTFTLWYSVSIIDKAVKQTQHEFRTRVFFTSWRLWTDVETVQAKREPSRGIATATITYFGWRCYSDAPGIMHPYILRHCFTKPKPPSRDRFLQLDTVKCTRNHMQVTSVLTTPWSRFPFEKLVEHQVVNQSRPFCRNGMLIGV